MRTEFEQSLMGCTVLGLALGAGIGVTPAFAQGEEPTTVGELVITASKREETVLKTPMAVTALSGETLDKSGVVTFNDLISRVPNVSMQDSGGGGVRPVIRGVSSFIGTPTVAVYIDETAIQQTQGYQGTAAGGGPEVDLMDLDRVEVLRGPQGTLYGASSMGGAIRYIMKKPALSGFDATARAEASITEEGGPSYGVGVTLGFAPVEDRFGIRISASHKQLAGSIDQIDRTTRRVLNENVDWAEISTARIAARYDANPDWSAVAAVFWQSREIGGFRSYASDLGFPYLDNILPEPGKETLFLPSLTITGRLGPLEITSATSYYRRQRSQVEDYSVLLPIAIPVTAGFVPLMNRESSKTERFTHELRVRYDRADRRAGVLVGYYYNDVEMRNLQRATGLGGAALLYNTTVDGTQVQHAYFGEAYWRPIDPLTLTVGVRQAYIKGAGVSYADLSPFAGRPTDVYGSNKEDATTFKFNASWELGPDAMIYAQAAQGFRPGGGEGGQIKALCVPEALSRGLPLSTALSSDKLWTYELGAKGRFLDRRAFVAGAVYQTKWEDKPEPIFLSSCGETYTLNVGEVTINGVELESTFNVTDRLTVNLAVGYNDATFDKTNLVAGVIAGEAPPFSPKWSVSLSGEHRFTLMNAPSYVRVDYAYRDEADQGVDAIVLNQTSDRYSVVNARIGMDFGDWTAEAYVNNLTNETPIVTAFTWRPGGPVLADRITTLRPRTLGVVVTKSW